MDSKEFGLVAAQQLFNIQDLHYGFWDEGKIPSSENFIEAQDNHTAFLLKHIEEAINADKKCKILDIGCGLGITTAKLLKMGYRVDGLVPSSWMAQKARNITQRYKDETRGEIYECNLRDFPTSYLSEKYTLVFFSESFQYVFMKKAFAIFDLILSETGKVIIFDFFDRDDVTEESPIGGGHSIGRFFRILRKRGYTVHSDLDVTANVSPTLKLLSDILVDRIVPFSKSLDAFLSARYRLLYRILRYAFRKELERVKYKYSPQRRNEENFQKFKTYRLFVLSRT